jgi:hypothetical protein
MYQMWFFKPPLELVQREGLLPGLVRA